MAQSGKWAWLMYYSPYFDLLLPIPGTTVMVTLGLVYGPILNGIIGSLDNYLRLSCLYLVCKIWKMLQSNCRPKSIRASENSFEKTGA